MSDIDVCFLSILYPCEGNIYANKAKEIRSQNISVIQYSLIDGLTSQLVERPWIINTPLLPLYPGGYEEPIVKESSIEGKYQGVNHGYFNFSPVKSTSLFYGAKKHIDRWLSSTQEKPKVAIAYSLTSYTLKAMKYIKKKGRDIKTCIIVPDLPQYTYGTSGSIVRRLFSLLGKTKVEYDIMSKAKFVDGWLLFSEKMKEKIPGKIKYEVFEGIYTDLGQCDDIENEFEKSKITILYAGGLHEKYGVDLLLEAFTFLEGSDWQLVLAGDGELKDRINDMTQNDNRIKYIGTIPHSELLRMERKADVLVNPRINSGIFTRYSFPSKNMEYLSMGVPIIAYKLEGIPDEYDMLINYFPEPTADSLADTIQFICTEGKAEAKKRAVYAQKYLSKKKSKEAWGEKIVTFLKEM